MAQITVQVYTTLRKILNNSKIKINADNVAEAINYLVNKFGDSFKEQLYHGATIKPYYILILNDKTLDKKHLNEYLLHENDVLHIFPPIAGG